MFLTLRLLVTDLRSLLQTPSPRKGFLGKGHTAAVRVTMQVVITLAVLLLCFYMIRDSSQSDAAKKVIYTLLGTVVGYWLR